MSGLSVLLVDDETVFVDNMASLLKNRGYDVISAYNGENALQALEKDNFDVIVLDLKMPGMDGITTLKKIKSLGIDSEILLLTGHGSVDTALEAMKIGASDYLTKPCEADELAEMIENTQKIKK